MNRAFLSFLYLLWYKFLEEEELDGETWQPYRAPTHYPLLSRHCSERRSSYSSNHLILFVKLHSRGPIQRRNTTCDLVIKSQVKIGKK